MSPGVALHRRHVPCSVVGEDSLLDFDFIFASGNESIASDAEKLVSDVGPFLQSETKRLVSMEELKKGPCRSR